ncbi:hypothetical protein [Brevibacillus formosus]|uniref:hypothetical protein n=1 Tax=Brevibacillus formosus TaxID=54913 RepID=UPI000A67856F|nr:hypothetical protein [Brevibacillus formosus]MED1957164.1 hypothetical protein [Brevibacillus formosus]
MSTLATNNSLWKNGSFVRLWCGTLFSAMADGAFFILLNWYIVNAIGSGAILGTTLICMSIPRLLFMLAGGVAADRLNRNDFRAFNRFKGTLLFQGYRGRNSFYVFTPDPCDYFNNITVHQHDVLRPS